jgi:tetratricopeptide (TPR) repeat protein
MVGFGEKSAIQLDIMRTVSLCVASAVFFGFAGACSINVLGQSASAAAPTYAQEPIVIVRSDTRYHMEADGTGFMEKTVVARIQSEATLKQLGVLAVPFAAKSQHVEWMYARVRHGDGTVTETPVTGAIEMATPVTREAPFYSDLKEMQLPLRDLRVGDTLEWQAKVVQTTAEAPGEFWGQETFQRDGVSLSQTVELEVPKDKYVTVWSPGTKPVERVLTAGGGGEHIYTWAFEQTKPTVGPEAEAFKAAEKKRVRTAAEELDTREGKLPDVAWTTFKSWEAVGAWYRGMEGDRMVADAEVKAKVAQLTAGKMTEQEKVQAVYAYVATQIHYIGVAFGIGRYQPHSAGDVLQNQYGDCKDKHTLLAAMLGALGLQPDAVLIGVGIRFNQAVPSPAAFNHLITRVEVDGKQVWLDTTAEVAPYGMLTYATRDHKALVVPATGVAMVETTPALPPFAPIETMDAKGTLDAQGTSVSRITLTFRGDDEVLMRTVLRQISAAQYDQFIQQFCAGIGYAGTASHMEISRVEDTSGPFTLSFDYKREKAGDWANYKTIAQLSPVDLVKPDEKEPPVQSIELGVPRVETSHAEMKLPKGWGVELPEAVHEKSAYATYDETYRFDKGTMYADRRIEVLRERVPVSDWKSYSKFAEKADLGNEQYIQLTRSAAAKAADSAAAGKDGAKSDAGGPPAPGENNAEAQKLVQKAYDAMQASDMALAETLLDQAKAINPKQAFLWSSYGYLKFRKGDMRGAVADYQKELSLHPANTSVYPSLVQTQMALKEKDDAAASLKQWSLADPANATPALMLAQMQISDGKPEEAVKTAETALKLAPADSDAKKSERLELMLGRAEIKAGAKAKGDETLTALLKGTDDTGLMNDAAYELADAGLELPLAEQTTRAALDKMEAQSRSWTLDENEMTLRQKSQLLQATWDTMGWVYFRAGKLAEAQNYVSAAWRGRLNAEVGGHLGEIAAARGEKNAALTDYELAQGTFANYDMMGVRTDPGAPQKKLMAKADALRKSGARTSVTDARTALQKLRTVPLGPAAGMNGVAEYKMLLSGDEVLRVEPSGENTLAGGEARLKRTKLPGFMPTGSNAQLVLVGMLNCHAGVCELVLVP